VSDEIEQVLERRHRWEWPPVPEGWRACDNQTFDDDGSLWRLVTSAPEHESPFEHEREWVEARRIDEQRWVTPWVEVSGRTEEASDGR
jgi:hypothetical protein